MEIDPRFGPVVVAIAGPNGAGKSTFFEALAAELGIGAYEAAEVAEDLRRQMLARRESFVFETVLSDPHGAKVEFLRSAAKAGYNVLLCFIGLDSAIKSDRRVSARVLQGGHDVPSDKLMARYPRTLKNLARALEALPAVRVYDNRESTRPLRFIAEYRDGIRVRADDGLPGWFRILIEPGNA